MRILLGIFLAFAVNGLMSYNSPAYGFTPLLPQKDTYVSTAVQTMKKSYVDTNDVSFDIEAQGAHLAIKAPLSDVAALGISAGHLAHTHFYGPLEAQGTYGSQVALSLDVGGAVMPDLFIMGLLRYTQDSLHFAKEMIADKSLYIELDSKAVQAGAGIRYKTPYKASFYARLERVISEYNEGETRFTVLGAHFDYELRKKTQVSGGVGLDLGKNVAIRFEKNWVGDESLTVAVDLSL